MAEGACQGSGTPSGGASVGLAPAAVGGLAPAAVGGLAPAVGIAGSGGTAALGAALGFSTGPGRLLGGLLGTGGAGAAHLARQLHSDATVEAGRRSRRRTLSDSAPSPARPANPTR